MDLNCNGIPDQFESPVYINNTSYASTPTPVGQMVQRISFSEAEIIEAMNALFSGYKTKFKEQKYNEVFKTYDFVYDDCQFTLVVKEQDKNGTIVDIKCVGGDDFLRRFMNVLTAQLQHKDKVSIEATLEENKRQFSETGIGSFLKILIYGALGFAGFVVVVFVLIFSVQKCENSSNNTYDESTYSDEMIPADDGNTYPYSDESYTDENSSYTDDSQNGDFQNTAGGYDNSDNSTNY